jgi:hypothetical protein
MDNWWVYIVEKETGLYVGITTDLENRIVGFGDLGSGFGVRFGVRLVYCCSPAILHECFQPHSPIYFLLPNTV